MGVPGCVVDLEGVLVCAAFCYLVGGGDLRRAQSPGEVAKGQVAEADRPHRMAVAEPEPAKRRVPETVDPGACREQFVDAVIDGRVVVEGAAAGIRKELCVIALAKTCRDNEL